MIVIVLVIILILAIAAYQASQGLFTSLVNAVLTLLTAMLAFAYYEPLAASLRESGMQLLADGTAMMLLLAVPLIVLRFIVDRYIVTDNVSFGPWADRIGGGLLGLFNGVVLVGMAALAMQMLPFDASCMGYLPYDANLQRKHTLMPFQPDEVVVSLADGLSRGSLGAAEAPALKDVHPNYPLELFCARNRAGRSGRITTPTDALTIEGAYLPPTNAPWLENVPPDSLLSEAQQRLARTIVVRVTVDEQARSAKDDWFRLPGTHFCLVTKEGWRTYPVGYLTHEAIDEYNRKNPERMRVIDREFKLIVENDVPGAENKEDQIPHPGRANLVVMRPWRKKGGPKKLTVDWVYRLPEGAEPSHVVFRRYSTAAVAEFVQDEMPAAENALQRIE
jgi:hypothetical protein